MQNTYEVEVRAKCPIHENLIDVYAVTITTAATITVERILEVLAPYEGRQVLQEVLTAEVAVALGAHVEVVGIHAGVKVTCVAP